MGNQVSIRHYFIEAFTPYGYRSYLSDLLKGVKNTYFFAGGIGSGKSTMIKLIGIQLIDRGYDVDYIRSIREPDSVAGLLIPKHKLGLLDKNEFAIPKFEKQYYREIDFDDYYRKKSKELHKNQREQLERNLMVMEQTIIQQLQIEYGSKQNVKADIKEELVSLHEENSAQEDALYLDEITRILSKVKQNTLCFRFLQGIHLDGWLNLAPRYIRNFDRICLEGEDSGKILRDILQEVQGLGQTIEIIVHPLKPYTVIGIVFPGKNLVVWKGNPSKMEEQGFVTKHSPSMITILEEYKKTRLKLKSLINDNIDFRGLDELRNELVSGILADIIE